jgi:hypothetical protein
MAVWNAEWAKPGTLRGEAVRGVLDGRGDEVVCLTEGFSGLLLCGGQVISSGLDHGYQLRGGRCKVMLWSLSGWSEVQREGPVGMPPGRFVSGITTTGAGRVRVVGVCIPWKDAHVRTGRRDRAPWEEHVLYLRALAGYLAVACAAGPLVVVGDFNQRIPRARVPLEVAGELVRALDGLKFATAGLVEPLGRQVIDHVAHSSEFESLRVSGWSRTRADGLRLSDHDGVRVELRRDPGRGNR